MTSTGRIGFRKKKATRTLMGRVTGLFASCAQIMMLGLALEVFGLVAPFFMQWVVDNVIVSADRDLLTTLAIGFGMLMLMQQTVSAVSAWILLYMGTRLSVQWRANVFSHLIRLPVQYFEKRHLGDVVSRFGATEQIQRTLTTSFLEAIVDGIMTIVTLAMMFLYSPMLGGIAVGAMLLYASGRWAWYSHCATPRRSNSSTRRDSKAIFWKPCAGLARDEPPSSWPQPRRRSPADSCRDPGPCYRDRHVTCSDFCARSATRSFHYREN
jgi:ABC-type bacteriocin/lantibiotic exporter with double-glycine peptidase domain